MTFDEIVGSLPSLNADELKDLKKRIGTFVSVGAGASVISSPRDMSDEELCCQVILEIIALRGIGRISVSQLRATSGYNQFGKKVVLVMKFIREAIPGVRLHEQRVLLHLGVRMLCDNMNHLHVPITYGQVLRWFHRIPALINRAFPGYAACGLLGLVIAQEIDMVAKRARSIRERNGAYDVRA